MDNPIWQALDAILRAAITAVVPVLTVAALAALRQWLIANRAKLGEQRWYQIGAIVSAAVKAAEQVGLVDEAMKAGNAKKQYALSRAQEWLQGQNIKVDLPGLSALVEAEVYTQFTQFKRLPAALPAG